MPSLRKSTLALGTVFVLLASSVRGGAVAADDAENQLDAGIKRAVELRKGGKDREALEELQRAAGFGHSARLTAQTGLAEQALGLWVAAEKHLNEALATSSDAWIRKNRHPLEQALSTISGHLAWLDVWGQPDGAEILLDGEPAGALPLAGPLRVPAETVELAVRAKGFVSASRSVELSPGANVREHVVLHAVDITPQLAPSPAAAAAPGGSIIAASPVASGQGSDQDHPSVFTRWWFWTIAAVIVGGATAAVVVETRKGSSCTATTCTNF